MPTSLGIGQVMCRTSPRIQKWQGLFLTMLLHILKAQHRAGPIGAQYMLPPTVLTPSRSMLISFFMVAGFCFLAMLGMEPRALCLLG